MSLCHHVVPVGLLDENCYLVSDAENARLWVIDPGAESETLAAEIEQLNLPEPFQTEILLTHAHVDHIGAVGALAETFHAKVRLHPDDVPLYHSKANALPPWVPAAENLPDTLPYEENPFYEMIHTPGHTRGGCCLLFGGLHVLFTGDTLFAGSIGRTDLPGGDAQTLFASIRDRLSPLDHALTVAPGHGSETTLGNEFLNNPYLVHAPF